MAKKPRIRPYQKNLVQLVKLFVRQRLLKLRLWYFRNVYKMDIGRDVNISLRADLDWTNPRGVHIDDESTIAFNAVVLAHDVTRLLHTHTYIGKRCFIGAHSIILPGVRVGDECIVGAGAVVTQDVPSGSIVAGNPAQIVRSGIRTLRHGLLADAYALSEALKAAESSRAPGTQLTD